MNALTNCFRAFLQLQDEAPLTYIPHDDIFSSHSLFFSETFLFKLQCLLLE